MWSWYTLFFISVQLYNNYVEINLHYFEVVQGGLLRCRQTEQVYRHWDRNMQPHHLAYQAWTRAERVK